MLCPLEPNRTSLKSVKLQEFMRFGADGKGD